LEMDGFSTPVAGKMAARALFNVLVTHALRHARCQCERATARSRVCAPPTSRFQIDDCRRQRASLTGAEQSLPGRHWKHSPVSRPAIENFRCKCFYRDGARPLRVASCDCLQRRADSGLTDRMATHTLVGSHQLFELRNCGVASCRLHYSRVYRRPVRVGLAVLPGVIITWIDDEGHSWAHCARRQ